jgi:hypothetical protein
VTKTLSSNLQSDLAANVTSLCTIWKVTRTDDTVLGFTDHDQDIVFGGVTYYAETGYTRSAIQSDSMLSVDNMEVHGILNSSYIDEHDLRNGVYNYARVDIFIVNWAALTHGSMQLRRGWFGEVTVTPNGYFTTELRGLTQALYTNFGKTIQPLCRADFGDTTGCHIPIMPTVWQPDTVYGPNTWIVAVMYTGDDVTIDPYMGTIWNTSANAGKGVEPTHGGGTSGSSPPAWFPGTIVIEGTDLAWTGASTFTIADGVDHSSVLVAGVPFQTNGFTNAGNNGGFVISTCTYATGTNTITVTQTTGVAEAGTAAAVFSETATGTIANVSDNGITWHPANSFTKQGIVTGATSNKIFSVSGLTVPTNELYGPLVDVLNTTYAVFAPALGGPFTPASTYDTAHPSSTLTIHVIANNGNTVDIDINVPGGGPINIINLHNNGSSNVDFQGNLSAVDSLIQGDSPTISGINWIDNATLTGTLTITAEDSFGNSFTEVLQMPPVETYYAGAILWFITGPNAGKSIEVKSFANDTITTWLSLPWLPEVGDVFRIYPGCDKRRVTCLQFGNAINFQGEPDLPGQDFLYAPNLSF